MLDIQQYDQLKLDEEYWPLFEQEGVRDVEFEGTYDDVNVGGYSTTRTYVRVQSEGVDPRPSEVRFEGWLYAEQSIFD